MATPTQSPQQGWNQSTSAQQQIMSMGLGGRVARGVRRAARAGARRAGKKVAKYARKVKRVARAAKRSGRARLVKGSAAAKAYMAKIRRKRK